MTGSVREHLVGEKNLQIASSLIKSSLDKATPLKKRIVAKNVIQLKVFVANKCFHGNSTYNRERNGATLTDTATAVSEELQVIPSSSET